MGSGGFDSFGGRLVIWTFGHEAAVTQLILRGKFRSLLIGNRCEQIEIEINYAYDAAR